MKAKQLLPALGLGLALLFATCGAQAGDGGGRAGSAWTFQQTGVKLFGITHGNGLFVAVGEDGTILTSLRLGPLFRPQRPLEGP